MNHHYKFFSDKIINLTKPYLCFYTSNDQWGKLRHQEILKISKNYPDVLCTFINFNDVKIPLNLTVIQMFDFFILLNNVEYEKSSCPDMEKVKYIFCYVDFINKLTFNQILKSLSNNEFLKYVNHIKSHISQKPISERANLLMEMEKSRKSQNNLKKKLINIKMAEKSQKSPCLNLKANKSSNMEILNINICGNRNELNRIKVEKNEENTYQTKHKYLTLKKLLKNETKSNIISNKIQGSSNKRKQYKPQNIESIRKMILRAEKMTL